MRKGKSFDMKLAILEARKRKAKATLEKKAMAYRTIINISFMCACTAVITLVLALMADQVQSGFVALIIISGLATIASALVFLAANVAKRIWRYKLFHQLGIVIPRELW